MKSIVFNRVGILSESIRLLGDWAPGGQTVDPLGFEEVSIFNLEGPVIHRDYMLPPVDKSGPCIKNGSLPIANGRLIAVLANNHLMDFGEAGLSQTREMLSSQNVDCCGAGNDYLEAIKPLIFIVGEIRVGLISRCEAQFGSASPATPGVAILGDDLYTQIRELKTSVDYVIVSIHAGAELSPWPSPARQDHYRALIDAGASVIHGHHSHVPQGWEPYKNGFIFYGLGNFCVDLNKWQGSFLYGWSLSPIIGFGRDGRVDLKMQYLEIDDSNKKRLNIRHKVDGLDSVQNYIESCNRLLMDRSLLCAVWQEVSIKMYKKFYADWLWLETADSLALRLVTCYRRIRSIVNILLKGERPYRQRLLYHLFVCASHQEALSTALGVLSGTVPDLRTLETEMLVNTHMPIDY